MRETMVVIARRAGIKTPPDLIIYDTEEYPHWAAFERIERDLYRQFLRNADRNAIIMAGMKREDLTPKKFSEAGVI